MDGGHFVGKRSLNFIRRAENNIKINRIGVNIHMEWSITSCNMVLRVQIPWLPPHATSNLMIVLTSGMVRTAFQNVAKQGRMESFCIYQNPSSLDIYPRK